MPFDSKRISSFEDRARGHIVPFPRRSGADTIGIEDFLDQNAGRFLYRLGGRLLSVLASMRAEFDGDLDKYMLYLVFVLDDMALNPSGVAPGPDGPVQRGLNQLSVAEITGIPRQSTRRKLKSLSDNGYLKQLPGGLYCLGDRFGRDRLFAELIPLFWTGSSPGYR